MVVPVEGYGRGVQDPVLKATDKVSGKTDELPFKVEVK